MARVVTNVVTVTCDICGVTLEQPGLVSANLLIYKEEGHRAVDLCPEHMEQIEGWVEQQKAAGNHS